MQFEWDEAKRRKNIIKHGIDFHGCSRVFDGSTATFEDRRIEYGEQRFKTLGFWYDSVVSIIHTETAETIRIISIRKATLYEQKIYFSTLRNELGQS